MSEVHEQEGAGVSGNHDHKPNSVPPGAARLIMRLFWGGCLLLVLLDFVIHRHEYHSWESVPVFYAIFGFIGVGGLILASKGLRRIVMRPEDYYDAQ